MKTKKRLFLFQFVPIFDDSLPTKCHESSTSVSQINTHKDSGFYVRHSFLPATAPPLLSSHPPLFDTTVLRHRSIPFDIVGGPLFCNSNPWPNTKHGFTKTTSEAKPQIDLRSKVKKHPHTYLKIKENRKIEFSLKVMEIIREEQGEGGVLMVQEVGAALRASRGGSLATVGRWCASLRVKVTRQCSRARRMSWLMAQVRAGTGEDQCQAVPVDVRGGRTPSRLMVKFRDANELILLFLFLF